MAFSPSPAQEGIREEARAAAEAIVMPGAEARDSAAVFPAEEIRALGSQGWLGMRGVGGAGGSLATLLTVSEFSRACASIGLLIGLHSLLVHDAIERHGSPETRGSFLSRLSRGDLLGAAATSDPMTAPSAGASAAVAVRSGAGYVLRGVKSFVPGAIGADLFLVYAFLEEGGGEGRHARRERCILIVPRETEGLLIDPPDRLVGVRASGAATIRFEGCLVPDSRRLAPDARARTVAKDLLACADLVVAAQAVGIAEAAFEKAARHAQEREPGGGLVGGHEAVQFKIADMKTSIETSRLLVQRAAITLDARDPDFAYCAAQAKAFAGRGAVEVADDAIQIHGGAGSLAGHGIERHWRDAKTTELNPSTRESALLEVARHLLDEARR
jgi:hypothetical protein